MNIELIDIAAGVIGGGVALYVAVGFGSWVTHMNEENNYLHLCKCLAPVPWLLAESPLVVKVMDVQDLYLLIFENGRTSGWLTHEDATTMQRHMTQFEFMVRKSDLDAHGIAIEMLKK